MITYKSGIGRTRVFLDKQPIGEIRFVTGGFQYFPKGQSTGGDIFKTVQECKNSLEQETA